MQACHLQTGALSLQRKGFVSAHFPEGQSKARCEAIVRGFHSEKPPSCPPGPGASELTFHPLLPTSSSLGFPNPGKCSEVPPLITSQKFN